MSWVGRSRGVRHHDVGSWILGALPSGFAGQFFLGLAVGRVTVFYSDRRKPAVRPRPPAICCSSPSLSTRIRSCQSFGKASSGLSYMGACDCFSMVSLPWSGDRRRSGRDASRHSPTVGEDRRCFSYPSALPQKEGRPVRSALGPVAGLRLASSGSWPLIHR
jgi:hypothetical protein